MNDEEYNGEQGGEQYYDSYNFEPVWVKALYDYDAALDTEISFKENDVICITADYEDGWWCGDLNGVVGRVPANYFEYINQDNSANYNQGGDGEYDADGNQIIYDADGNQQYYDTDGNLQYYDNSGNNNQYTYDTEHGNGYDGDQQNDGDDGDADGNCEMEDESRKELLRQKRELYKKEMKELQDNLKNASQAKDKLSGQVEKLESKREELEDNIRLLKLLKFINLEIIKTEIDIDVDSDSSTTSRQTGIAITQDLKSIRTILGGLKSSSVDISKKQFDGKLEEIEKKVINNLNLLDSCDNLKKSLLLSLQVFQNILVPLIDSNSNSINISNNDKNNRKSSLPPPPPSGSPVTSYALSSNLQMPPPTIQLPPPPQFVPSTSANTPNPFFSSPATVLLSDKDKRKSVKEAKKIEKLEKKEEKKLEKLEKSNK